MTSDELMQLKAAAKLATEGPWMRLFGERTIYDRMEDGCRGNPIVRADTPYGQDVDNLNFIAAANPAKILALIAKVESLAADAERLDQLEKIMGRSDNGPHLYSLGRCYEGETMREVLDFVMAKEKA